MHKALKDITERIVRVARGALTQAEHWEDICVLNAAHAGELFIKAVVAREHPLLIFRELLPVDDMTSVELNIKKLIERGRTYDFKDLPRLLWIPTSASLTNRLLRSWSQSPCGEKVRTDNRNTNINASVNAKDVQDASDEMISGTA